jgi:hypothetical protein
MTKRYDIYNPSPARRIIHNGLAEPRAIEVLPRKSVDGVELADSVAERLIALSKTDPNTELHLKEVVPSDEEKIPAMKMTVDDSKIDVIKARGRR